ncbi:MAG: hypothetical protein ACJAZP_003389 [Psychromonas sp.]|jgi:hypothetical protein|uniref:lipid A-modifier LpxR family protein n=1 Tax=Psychromonas sp. TaxID=1884585 RepID=UPI0039E3B530
MDVPSFLFAGTHGWYFFVNTSAFYVANDIFINGNTFQDSHSVSLIHDQIGISASIVANFYQWNLVYTLFRQSDEYQGKMRVPATDLLLSPIILINNHRPLSPH